MWEVEPSLYPKLQKLRPYYAKLEANDAIYIPVFWWHAVEPMDDQFGITLAFPFKSPPLIQFDIRYPAVRWTLRLLCQAGSWKVIFFVILGSIFSFLRHPIKPPYMWKY